jgi:hypothetical protein
MLNHPLAKHILWAVVLVVLACLGIVAFGDEQAVEVASGVLAGIGLCVVLIILMIPMF